MTEKSGTFIRAWARIGLAAVALAFGASQLLAQATSGKVEGSVADPTGQPVAGAQVLIVGTSFGALTNESGYWFINNVPVGVYSLRAQFIGYQPAEVQNVRVLGGQTITVNFDLQGAVALGAITVTVQQNPIVPRDQVSSRTIVTGNLVNDLPVDNVRAVLALQPGVVESGRGAGLSIRGGRPGEAAVFVDGALVRSVQSGASNLNVGTNALEEASITTGAIGAEFGDAQSGIIAFNTRAGGSSFDGAISYQTDEPFGDGTSVGFNRIEASLSGPLAGNLTFSLAGTLEGQQSSLRGIGADQVPVYVLGGLDTAVTEVLSNGNERTVEIPRFVQFSGECDPASNFGFECQGRRLPYNWNTNLTAQGKLQYTYGSGSRISGTWLRSQDQFRNWSRQNSFAPQQTTGTRNWSNAFILNWTQQVMRSAEGALAFDVNLSYQTDNSLAGPMARDYEVSKRDPFGGFVLSPIEHLIDFDRFSDDDPADPMSVTSLNSQADWDQLIDNIRTNRGTRTPFLDRNDLRDGQAFRMNPYAMATAYTITGVDAGVRLDQERRFQGRFNVDWQFDRFNRFKFGGDFRTARVNHFSSGMLRQSFMDVYTENPLTYGLYGQDRLDLGDVVIELGVRWDYFDTRSLIAPIPGRIFSDPGFDLTLTNPDSLYGVLTPAGSHSKVSPRVLVSFPVTDRTGFRLSYSHQVQSPDFGTVLTGINNDLSFTNTNDVFARDVDFGKTILFEFGVRHAFNQDMVIDISAYNKDKVSDLAARNLPFFDPVTSREVLINVLTNADFGNTRGVDFQLIRRISDFFNGTFTYTFQTAKNTGSDPFSYLRTTARQISAVTNERVDPPQAILPTDDNRTHNIVGALSFTFPRDFAQGTWYGSLLRDGGAFIRYRFASGLPYTRLTNGGNGQTAPFLSFGLTGQQAEPINSSTMPWIKQLDLRVTKGFAFGATDWTLFADFRNVLNLETVTSLFTETGDIVNGLHRTAAVDPSIQRLEAEAESFLIQTTGSEGEPINAIALPADCNAWGSGPVNCVLLKRAEARWGDGDGVYSEEEYTAAFNANYEILNGRHSFLSAPRHVRIGFELRF